MDLKMLKVYNGTKCTEAKEISRKRVAENVTGVLELAEREKCSPTTAAHYLAYERIFHRPS